MLYRTGTHLHRTSGTSRGSARHCPGPQHRRHKRVGTAGGCPTLAALSPQLQAGHTLLTPVFLGAGTQSLRRAAAPHPLSGRPRVLKVIPSFETALSVEWATPVLSLDSRPLCVLLSVSRTLESAFCPISPWCGSSLLDRCRPLCLNLTGGQCTPSHWPLATFFSLSHVSQTPGFLGSSDCY